MEQPSRRAVVDRLVERLSGGDVYHASPTPDTPVTWPTLVFGAPRFDLWLNGCLVVLGVVILIAFLGLLTVLVQFSGDRQVALVFALGGIPVSFLLAVMCMSVIDACWMARWGKIVLAGDRLVEYTMLNHRRAFTYQQIYEIRSLREIRYYAYDESGQIDYESIRYAHLSTVRAPRKLTEELQRRICAPPPSSKAYSAFLERVVGKKVALDFGGGALILVIVSLAWAMPSQRWLYGLAMVILVPYTVAVAWIKIKLGLERRRERGVPAWMDA